MLAAGVAGCVSTGQPPAPTDLRGVTIAFESIDGPPPAVTQKMVRELQSEAGTRQIAVVPQGGQAMYRIRGYLAAQPDQGGTAIAWAWDVYDAEQRRIFRLRGEDKAAAGRAWAAADDQVLRRIARSSIDQIATYLASGRALAAAGGTKL